MQGKDECLQCLGKWGWTGSQRKGERQRFIAFLLFLCEATKNCSLTLTMVITPLAASRSRPTPMPASPASLPAVWRDKATSERVAEEDDGGVL